MVSQHYFYLLGYSILLHIYEFGTVFNRMAASFTYKYQKKFLLKTYGKHFVLQLGGIFLLIKFAYCCTC
jgi:hypothetical protein